MLVDLDAIIRRNDFLPLVDLFQPLAVVRINQAELELGHARKLIARFLNLRRIEARNLDENAIVTDRSDDRFAAAEIIDALADDFDRLVEHRLGDLFVAFHQADQE